MSRLNGILYGENNVDRANIDFTQTNYIENLLSKSKINKMIIISF